LLGGRWEGRVAAQLTGAKGMEGIGNEGNRVTLSRARSDERRIRRDSKTFGLLSLSAGEESGGGKELVTNSHLNG